MWPQPSPPLITTSFYVSVPPPASTHTLHSPPHSLPLSFHQRPCPWASLHSWFDGFLWYRCTTLKVYALNSSSWCHLSSIDCQKMSHSGKCRNWSGAYFAKCYVSSVLNYTCDEKQQHAVTVELTETEPEPVLCGSKVLLIPFHTVA